ncbi:response regulator [bacterium]|nr:response regulator [bacterium]
MTIKVLIVDDEKDFTETLAERLRFRKFDVDCANSGKEALEKIGQQSFDVILLDVLMPEMDGIETYAEMRKLDDLVPVIMLTGHAKIETAINGIKAGVYDYLVKPVKIEDLVGKIIMAHKLKIVSTERIDKDV